jgi:hypothetical protein
LAARILSGGEVSMSNLKKLAKQVFELTRRESWDAGELRGDREWSTVAANYVYPHRYYWTKSPKVSLCGHQVELEIRTAIFGCIVVVLVDGEIQHPGGWWRSLWPWRWCNKIARQEAREGGIAGPVDVADLLLIEAESRVGERMHGPESGSLSLTGKTGEDDGR